MMNTKQIAFHWATIAAMGWGRTTTDYEAIAREYYKKLGKDGMKSLEKFVNARVEELMRAVTQCEKDLNTELTIGSDDGFSDVTHHIVGMGKDEWDMAITDPRRVEARYKAKYGSPEGYTESFAYCFQEPEPERTEKDKQESILEMERRAGEVQKLIRGLQENLYTLQQQAHTLHCVVTLVKKDHGL